MKRIALFLAVLIIFLAVNPVFTSADNDRFLVDIEDGEIVGGIRQVLFSSGEQGALSAKLDGEKLTGRSADEVALCFSASGIDYTNNSLFADGVFLGSISKGLEEEKIELNIDLLTGEVLEITLLPSIGSTVLDTAKAYGSYNVDDLVLTSIYLLLPMGQKLYPEKVIKGMPIQGSAGYNSVEEQYNKQSITIGDGWNQSTGFGGTTPNVPIFATFRFDLSKTVISSQNAIIYDIDTTTLPDGEKTIEFFIGEEAVGNVKIIIDNTPPLFVSNLSFGQTVYAGFAPEITAEDANGVASLKIFLNGKPYDGKPLTNIGGANTITAYANDTCGNASAVAYQFNVANGFTPIFNPDAVELKKGGNIKITVTEDKKPASALLYSFTPINDIKAYLMGDKTKPYGLGMLTSTGAEENPAHFFDLAVPDSNGALKIEYLGRASENTDINIFILRPSDGVWELAGTSHSGSSAVITVPNPADYIKDGSVSIKAEPALYISGSDSVMWLSDTQYYSRFENLYPTYESVMNYAVELYGKGEIGYFIHTGDVVDDYIPADIAKRQYEAASSIQKIIDDAGVPNGIVSGNHDVDMRTANHDFFGKYFGSERYSGSIWYGGDLNNNTNHYDLVTIGGYDFVFLYLGWGVEDHPETVAWAKAVLDFYAARNAILCLHGYLGTDGNWYRDPANPYSYTHTRGKEVWEGIVVPNQNIVAVFCGHVHGAARNRRQVEGTDRYVWEILANYQFAELGVEPKNVLNGMTCDGEGFIRLVRFTEDGKMEQKTYSPLHDIYNFFSPQADSFTVELPLRKTDHTLTTDSISAVCGYMERELDTNNAENGFLTLSADKSLTGERLFLLLTDANGEKYNAEIIYASNGTVYIAIIAGIVLLLGLTGLVYLLKKRKV